jgi:glycosyltransferase involved in cell wall biosynthesis
LKILHIIAAYKPAVVYGGPTMSVAMLCEELVKGGAHVEVFTTTANGATELPVTANTPTKVDGVTVTYFKRLTKDHTHFSPALLKALWKRAAEFDAIHIHAWWNLVSIFSCLIALRRGIPVILSPRGTLSNYSFTNNNTGKKRLIHKFLGKNLLAKCHVHITSVREAEAITKLVAPKSITTISNFVKIENAGMNALAPVSFPPLKLLFFSRIEEKKGLDILLDALPLLTVPFHLTIAGDGDKSYIDQLKASVHPDMADKVTWAGFYNDDKFDLLRRHHLMVLPSHDENFGNVVIESLSVGTAVLVSENVGLAGYVNEHQLGWVCSTNTASISAAINDIVNNQYQQFEVIRTSAPDIVRGDFTGDKLVQQYIGLYKNLK